MNPRIRVMVDDSRELEEVAADGAEIARMWRKAVRSFHDSRMEGLGVDSAVVLAYQSGLQAATTVVRAAGYRVKDTPKGHHRIAFEALTALGIVGVSELGRHLNAFRPTRHAAMYDAEPESRARLDEIEEIVGRLLPLAYHWLRSHRPEIAEALVAPNG